MHQSDSLSPVVISMRVIRTVEFDYSWLTALHPVRWWLIFYHSEASSVAKASSRLQVRIKITAYPILTSKWSGGSPLGDREFRKSTGNVDRSLFSAVFSALLSAWDTPERKLFMEKHKDDANIAITSCVSLNRRLEIYSGKEFLGVPSASLEDSYYL